MRIFNQFNYPLATLQCCVLTVLQSAYLFSSLSSFLAQSVQSF